MTRWEYCQLEPNKGRKVRHVYQAYYSSQERADNVDRALEEHVFTSWRGALNYLGNAGWEAFHIDAKGVWYFKQQAKEDDADWKSEDTPSRP
jgi:hypothetical protein